MIHFPAATCTQDTIYEGRSKIVNIIQSLQQYLLLHILIYHTVLCNGLDLFNNFFYFLSVSFINYVETVITIRVWNELFPYVSPPHACHISWRESGSGHAPSRLSSLVTNHRRRAALLRALWDQIVSGPSGALTRNFLLCDEKPDESPRLLLTNKIIFVQLNYLFNIIHFFKSKATHHFNN